MEDQALYHFPLWAKIVFVLVITALLGFGIRRLFAYLAEMKGIPQWGKTLCKVSRVPSAWFVWIYGLLLFTEYSLEVTEWTNTSDLIAKIREIFLIVFIAWFLITWKNKYQEVIKKRVSTRPTKAQDLVVITALSKVMTIAIVIVSAIIILDIFEVQLTAILALSGIGGVAVGFAGKDIVANFFGGVMIHINRPFFVGERITSLNKNFDGFVSEIGWYSTQIQTLQQRPAYIPNALFIDAIIENSGRMTNRRINQKIGIRYDDIKKVKAIVNDIQKLIDEHPEIDLEKRHLAHFTEFGESSVNIDVVCYTKSIDLKVWRDVQQDIFLKIVDIVESHNAEFAFPTTTVHLFQESQEQKKS